MTWDAMLKLWECEDHGHFEDDESWNFEE